MTDLEHAYHLHTNLHKTKRTRWRVLGAIVVALVVCSALVIGTWINSTTPQTGFNVEMTPELDGPPPMAMPPPGATL